MTTRSEQALLDWLRDVRHFKERDLRHVEQRLRLIKETERRAALKWAHARLDNKDIDYFAESTFDGSAL